MIISIFTDGEAKMQGGQAVIGGSTERQPSFSFSSSAHAILLPLVVVLKKPLAVLEAVGPFSLALMLAT